MTVVTERKAGEKFMIWLKSLQARDCTILTDIDYVSLADGVKKKITLCLYEIKTPGLNLTQMLGTV